MSTLPVAPADPRVAARTVEVDDVEPLLGRLPASGPLAWVRDGEGLVGWGEAARVEFTGPERFSRAQRWWAQFCADARIDDPIGLPGTGPVAFASFAFDREPGRSVLVVPKVVVGRRGDLSWLTVVDGVGRLPDATAVLRPVASPRRPTRVRYAEGALPVPAWESAVAEAVARIARGELDKVVLARDVVVTLDEPVDVRHLLLRLAERYPECWTFNVDGLVGATPELLVRRAGDVVTSRVLAGTVRREGDHADDARLARALLGSGKDLAEHEYAVQSVAEALAAHCTDLDVPQRPKLLRLANVQHLATDVTGRLADGAPALALAASLHPTAAVCGTPTERAFAVIRELEGMDRGRYAGPVGWVDARGDGEFGIALRCAQVDPDDGSRLRLFAGCGLVAGSEPESELAESQAKLVAMRDALESA